MCIIFIGSSFIVPEKFPWDSLKIVSGPYPNWTNIFDSPAGLWKVMSMVMVFLIAPVDINTLIGFKAVPQFLQVFSCVGKYKPKGHKRKLG